MVVKERGRRKNLYPRDACQELGDLTAKQEERTQAEKRNGWQVGHLVLAPGDPPWDLVSSLSFVRYMKVEEMHSAQILKVPRPVLMSQGSILSSCSERRLKKKQPTHETVGDCLETGLDSNKLGNAQQSREQKISLKNDCYSDYCISHAVLGFCSVIVKMPLLTEATPHTQLHKHL